MSVLIGLKDLHYAELTDDSKTDAVYGTPVNIAGAITGRISPKVSSDVLYADDGAAETASALGEIEVEFVVKDLPLSVQAALLGHTLDTDGALYKNASDIAPYVAIGFKSLKTNGKYRYVWLYKGKFQPVEEEYETKKDNTSFKTPTIKGIFVKREFDGMWEVIGDEDETGFTVGETWFDTVYKKPVV